MQKLKRNDSGMWVMVAHEGEFAHPNANICYTGIGKVNAAIATQHIIDTERPRLILSLGTAGSSVFDYGQIVNPVGWVQRDMNTTEFFAPKYVIPFSNDAPVLEYGRRDPRYAAAVCGSGDTFVRNISEDIWNCVEMEGFAMAYACRAAGVPFAAYKFISDGKSADTTDHEWAETLAAAQTALHKVYEEIEK
ncbi:MAG: 5'-methylthioadenosine/S-adenosylhomocysteine nucleosidase [Alphaproteobacteria bacterium]|nr:5'-methylthioadenosine/S-adenosylhomocysteine nucleosidase [Alphaproteobacteria bacterium]